MPEIVTIKDVMAYFDMSAATFAREWKKLSTEEKNQLKAGIANESLSY